MRLGVQGSQSSQDREVERQELQKFSTPGVCSTSPLNTYQFMYLRKQRANHLKGSQEGAPGVYTGPGIPGRLHSIMLCKALGRALKDSASVVGETISLRLNTVLVLHNTS
jgi:hypothetical protein